MFHEEVKSLHERMGISKVELSRLTDIPLRTLEDWEAGRRTPALYTQRMVLFIFRCIIAEIEETELPSFLSQKI